MKRDKGKPKKPSAPPKLDKKTEIQIKRIRDQLREIKEYKALIAADGLEPDEEDKRRESELIVKLLRLEKGKGAAKAKSEKGKKPAKPKAQTGRRARTKRKRPPQEPS